MIGIAPSMYTAFTGCEGRWAHGLKFNIEETIQEGEVDNNGEACIYSSSQILVKLQCGRETLENIGFEAGIEDEKV